MYAVFERAGVGPSGQRGYHMLWHLSQTGTLCFGPPYEKQQTFVLLDEWIPFHRHMERDEALGEFVLRYFRSHGPATVADFAWWSSLPIAAARIGLAVARDALSEIVRDGVSHYFASDARLDPAPDGIRRLPGFDEYLLGYKDRRPQLDDAHKESIVPGGNGMFRSTIVRDGVVIGTWKRTLSARRVSIAAAPFERVTPGTQRAVARAGNDYARFLERQQA